MIKLEAKDLCDPIFNAVDRRWGLKPHTCDYVKPVCIPSEPQKAVHLPGSAAVSPTPPEGASQHVLLLPYSKSIWIHTFQSITACCHQTYPV